MYEGKQFKLLICLESTVHLLKYSSFISSKQHLNVMFFSAIWIHGKWKKQKKVLVIYTEKTKCFFSSRATTSVLIFNATLLREACLHAKAQKWYRKDRAMLARQSWFSLMDYLLMSLSEYLQQLHIAAASVGNIRSFTSWPLQLMALVCLTASQWLTKKESMKEWLQPFPVEFLSLTFFSRRIPSCVCASVTISNMPWSSPSTMLYVDLALSPMSLSFAFTLPPIFPNGRSSGIINSYRPVEEQT